MTIYTTSALESSRQRARNRTIAGIVLSILIHIALFWIILHSLDDVTPPSVAENKPLQVSLVPTRPTVPQSVPQAPTPPKPKSAAKPQHRPKLQPQPRTPPMARAPNNRAAAARPLAPSPSAQTQAAPEMDMSTMINAARERRRAAEESAAQENAAARESEAEPSANDIASANIAFQERRAQGATSGVFQVISKGPRIAQYIFRGWTTDARHSRAQTFTVDAGPGGDVEKAIVDDMIRVIRQYYKGDFNWNSYRLGRVVTLSAREEDTAGLRAFIMHEIFD